MDYKKSSSLAACMILIVLLFGCAPIQVSKVTEKMTVKTDTVSGKTFSEAENLFQNNEYDSALEAYKGFINQYPKDQYADNALFRIGEILFTQNQYPEALKYYQRILDNFLTSEVYSEAEYKIGLCYYYMKLFDRSIAILTKILPQFSEPDRKAEIKTFIAGAYIEKQQYLRAITEYMDLLVLVPESNLVNEAKQAVVNTIGKMDRASLEEVINKYPDEFPSGYARFQLGQLSFQSRDYKEAKTILEGFLIAMPKHEYSERAKQLLSVMETPYVGDKTKIGAVLPLSGKGAMAGQKILHGIQLSFSNLQLDPQMNRFQLVIKDSASNPRRAAEAVAELAIEDKVIAIIGPVFSSTAKEAAEVADRYRIPIFSPFAHNRGIPELSGFVFRNSLTNDMQGKAIAEYAYHSLGLTTFAILYPENLYGQELRDIFITHILRLGGEIKHVVPYDTKVNDFSSEIKKIGGLSDEEYAKIKKQREESGDPFAYLPPLPASPTENPTEDLAQLPVGAEPERPVNPNPNVDYEAIFIPGYYDKVGLIAPALPFYNINQVTLLGVNGWNSPKLIPIGERYVEGAIFVDGFFLDSPNHHVMEFVKNYRETFGEDPDILAAQAYDATEMTLQALRTAGTRYELKEALLQIQNYPGVSGTTTITLSGDSEKTLFILSIKKGKIVQVD